MGLQTPIGDDGCLAGIDTIVVYLHLTSDHTMNNWSAGPMARRLTTNQEIAGSIPASIRIVFLCRGHRFLLCWHAAIDNNDPDLFSVSFAKQSLDASHL
jgi:hypothetical protein